MNLRIHTLGVREIEYGIADATEQNALMHRGQEACAPVRCAAARTFAAGTEHDECRQVLRFRTEAVCRPRAHARPTKLLRAGAHQNLSRRVIESIGVHGLHNSDVVHDFGKVRQQFRQFRAALAVLRELEFRSKQCRARIDERGAIVLDEVRGRLFAVPLHEFRFVVEQLQVAWRTGLEEKDDPLHLRGKMRVLWCERIGWRNRRRPAVFAKQSPKGNGPQSHAALLKKPAARDQLRVKPAIKFVLAVHDYSFVIVSSKLSSTRDTTV